MVFRAALLLLLLLLAAGVMAADLGRTPQADYEEVPTASVPATDNGSILSVDSTAQPATTPTPAPRSIPLPETGGQPQPTPPSRVEVSSRHLETRNDMQALDPKPQAGPTAISQPHDSQALSAATPEVLSASPGDPLRVGIQAGHWKNEELPEELSGLRGSTGAEGYGWREVDVNLDIARRVAALLVQAEVQVDILPATVPVDYKADAFLALHGDANANAAASGYKLARATWSSVPEREDALLQAVGAEYREATGLREHPQTITENMLQYYAFNSQRLEHAVDPTTPAVILEMGFLTNPADRALLLNEPDRVAAGIAAGILDFLDAHPD